MNYTVGNPSNLIPQHFFKENLMPASRLATLCFVFTLGFFAHGVSASDFPLPEVPHIVVIGEGEVEQVPDVINLTVQVSQTAQNFAEAKKQVDYIVGKVIIAAKERTVLMDDINASKIHAVPQFEWQNQERVYKGEQVNRTVNIKLLKSERYNDLVDALLAVGITRLQDVRFEFSNRHELEADALKLAIDDANAKAKTIAKHLRTKLQKPFQVSPVTSQPIMQRMEMTAMADMSGPEPKGELTPGKQIIQQQVRIVYLLQ